MNPFEYLTWILTNAPNLGKPGFAGTVNDFLPGSSALPDKVFAPRPNNVEPEKYREKPLKWIIQAMLLNIFP